MTVGLVEPRLTGLAKGTPSAGAADTGAVRWDGRLVSDATGEAGRLCQAVIAGGGVKLWRGHGHARAGSTPAGVNGLHEMGGNAWEWVDEPPRVAGQVERRTRGGSWWYGAAQMRADHLQSKPPETTAVYTGFRCVRRRPK